MNVKICQRCGKCCYSNIGAFIFPSDVKKISDFMQLTPADFVMKWCEEHVLHINNENVKIFTLKIKDGKYSFLNDNLCKIFDCRPYQCMNAPYNFLAKYSFWSHMACVEKEDFIGIDSSLNDRTIFSELLDNGYTNI